MPHDAVPRAEPVLRRLRADDAESLYDFYMGLSPGTLLIFRPMGWQPDFALVEGVCRGSETGARYDIVLEAGGEIVGWAFLTRLEEEYLDLGIGLADGWQGRGLGKPLMSDLVRFARDLRKRGIGLIVVQDNYRAQALYETYGFRRTGTHRGQDGLDYYTMTLELEPEAAP